MNRPSTVLAFALAAVTACAGPSEPVAREARTICDGSDDLRFMATVLGGGGLVDPVLQVLMENGPFILIDGRCRFWVAAADNKHEEVRTGVIEPETLAMIAADFRYDFWPELEGPHYGDAVVFDASDIVFVDRETSVACVANCLGDGVPADVVAMREAYLSWNRRLWAAGVAVGGPVRIRVLEVHDPDWLCSEGCVDWPVSEIAIDSIAEPPDAWGTTPSVLLAGADADALRVLRRAYLDGQISNRFGRFYAMLIGEASGPAYYANARDTTPFEDVDGRISWEGP